ncbi:hypothetical protein FS837_012993 [Tulasnella sp. UAMH 9824]|nr:hypothetical protein FS837_012993 [Tulasnella sp. UAMH 9824]
MNPDVPVKLLYYVAINQGTYVLPRIRAIHWDATEDRELQLLISLISPSIKEFDIDVWECKLEASSRLLRALRFILPRDLSTFRFKSVLDKTPTENVSAIIRQQDSLQTLKLPSCALDTFMFKPTLRVLEAYCTVGSGRTPQQALGALVEGPLLHSQKLISVDLDYPGRWNLEKSDIKAMGDAWPELESLNLCCTRDYPELESSHGMPMRMLPTLARHLSPKLRRLALFLNTTDVPLPSHQGNPFSNLEIFAVGNSPLDSETAVSAVAAYLDAVLPPKVEQIYSNSLARQSGSVFEPFLPRFRQNRAWESVDKLFSKLRRESRGGAAK